MSARGHLPNGSAGPTSRRGLSLDCSRRRAAQAQPRRATCDRSQPLRSCNVTARSARRVDVSAAHGTRARAGSPFACHGAASRAPIPGVSSRWCAVVATYEGATSVPFASPDRTLSSTSRRLPRKLSGTRPKSQTPGIPASRFEGTRPKSAQVVALRSTGPRNGRRRARAERPTPSLISWHRCRPMSPPDVPSRRRCRSRSAWARPRPTRACDHVPPSRSLAVELACPRLLVR